MCQSTTRSDEIYWRLIDILTREVEPISCHRLARLARSAKGSKSYKKAVERLRHIRPDLLEKIKPPDERGSRNFRYSHREMLALHDAGFTCLEIANRLGSSYKYTCKVISRARKTTPTKERESPEPVTELRDEEYVCSLNGRPGMKLSGDQWKRYRELWDLHRNGRYWTKSGVKEIDGTFLYLTQSVYREELDDQPYDIGESSE